jgi:hypothetical protein
MMVWPALFPPAKRAQMSASADSISTSLPFPSSPHCAPRTAVTNIYRDVLFICKKVHCLLTTHALSLGLLLFVQKLALCIILFESYLVEISICGLLFNTSHKRLPAIVSSQSRPFSSWSIFFLGFEKPRAVMYTVRNDVHSLAESFNVKLERRCPNASRPFVMQSLIPLWQ